MTEKNPYTGVMAIDWNKQTLLFEAESSRLVVNPSFSYTPPRESIKHVKTKQTKLTSK